MLKTILLNITSPSNNEQNSSIVVVLNHRLFNQDIGNTRVKHILYLFSTIRICDHKKKNMINIMEEDLLVTLPTL